MATTITVKGQVTIPKHIRDALKLAPGSQVEFAVENEKVVLYKTGARRRNGAKKDRFDRARGAAEIKWDPDELMALLRGDD